MADDNGKGSNIDFQDDDESSLGLKVDTAALAAGAFYGSVPLIGLSFAKAASIEAQAEFAKRLDGAENFILDAGSGGPIDRKTRDEREKEANERAFAYSVMLLDELEERREREWDRAKVSIGQIEMTGEEWDRAFEVLSDPKTRDAIVEQAMQNRGWKKDHAEKAADDALRLAEIARRKKDGTITPADEAEAERITRNNPDAAIMVREAARYDNGRGLEWSADQSPAKSRLSSDAETSVVERQKAMMSAPVTTSPVGKEPFASAPDLTARFDTAREAATLPPATEPTKPLPTPLVAKIDMDSVF